jgi:hypothetical protein
MNRKKEPNVTMRFFGAGLFLLMAWLCAGPAYGADVTLAWDPNQETDLQGYAVYFRSNTPGPPYNLFGYFTTDDLSDPASPTVTVTGLNKGASYYFAVTAYNTKGNESGFSNSVCAQIGDVIAPCSEVIVGGGGGSGGSSGGGSGGGGGAACLIETASVGAAGISWDGVALTVLGCLIAGWAWAAKRRSKRLLPFRVHHGLRMRSANDAGRR